MSYLFCGPGSTPTEPPVKISKIFDLIADAQASAPGTSLASRYVAFAAPVSVDRSIYRKTDAKFNIIDFLSPFSRAVYLDPSLVERTALPEWAQAVPRLGCGGGVAQSWSADDGEDGAKQGDDCFDDVPVDVLFDALDAARTSAPAPTLQRGSDRALFSFYQQWDTVGQLVLTSATEIPSSERGSWFGVPTSDVVDRMVFNRIPRNRRELLLEGGSPLHPERRRLNRAPCASRVPTLYLGRGHLRLLPVGGGQRRARPDQCSCTRSAAEVLLRHARLRRPRSLVRTTW